MRGREVLLLRWTKTVNNGSLQGEDTVERLTAGDISAGMLG
jgi:hypothetical protein